MSKEDDELVNPKPKWIKRGPQPDAGPMPTSGTKSVISLLAKINAETDPIEKAKMEAQFKAECDLYDQIHPDSMPMDIAGVYSEIVSTVAPIASQAGVEIALNGVFEADMKRDKWQVIHRQIIQCKRMAATWLSKSRKFAVERWGIDFVTESEVQMELALGIEHKQAERQEPSVEALTTSVRKVALAWCGVIDQRIDTLGCNDALKMLGELKPMVETIHRLEAMAAKELTA